MQLFSRLQVLQVSYPGQHLDVIAKALNTLPVEVKCIIWLCHSYAIESHFLQPMFLTFCNTHSHKRGCSISCAAATWCNMSLSLHKA